ncbi:MAG: class B sortase [Eubacteriales bacterium]
MPLILARGVCVIVLAVSIWQLSSIFLEYKAGTDEYDKLQDLPLRRRKRSDVNEDDGEKDDGTAAEDADGEERVQRVAISELQVQNPDTVGWIQIPGTGISYPLMHTGDDSYYLNHTFSKKVNGAGSIFVETLNSADFSDLHTIIYGHNMKNGSMFAGLKEYRSASYLVDHPNVYVDLADGTHAYQIFSVYEADADSDSYTIGFAPDETYEEYLKTIKGRSLYDTGVTVTREDSIITLSTCTKHGEKRFLVHAKKLY